MVEESPLVKRAQADEALGGVRLKDTRRERVPDLNVTAGEWYSGEEVMSGAKAGWESFVQAGVQLRCGITTKATYKRPGS